MRKGLIRFGIALREAHQHHGHPAQTRYGKQIRKNREVDHKVEKRTIEVVKELHSQNLSLRQIAKVLNQIKIPTKCQGKQWHPQMIKRILDSEK